MSNPTAHARIEGAEKWFTVPCGATNTITDVPDVQVGHATLHSGETHTGVTAVIPQPGDLYRHKLVAGAAILNGFGKSSGLMQVMELGQIETPILLSNTFAVPACSQALIQAALQSNPEIGRSQATVNPLVLECNDGRVNDIRTLGVTEELANDAIAAAAKSPVTQGTIGAGTGMQTFGLAGAVGSASRSVDVAGGARYTLGALVLSNFGQASELRVLGRRVTVSEAQDMGDKGSIIIVLATDAPLDSRQLGRLSRRAAPALGRLGSFMGHGSGDIALAFSTANRISAASQSAEQIERLAEPQMDAFFLAGVEAIEEAILNGLWHATPQTGHDGRTAPVLRDLLLL